MSTQVPVTRGLLALAAALNHAKQQHLAECEIARELHWAPPTTFVRAELLGFAEALGLTPDLRTMKALLTMEVPAECLTTAPELLPRLYVFDPMYRMGNGAIIRRPETLWVVRLQMKGGCGFRWEGDAINAADAKNQAIAAANTILPQLSVSHATHVTAPTSPQGYLVAEAWPHIFNAGDERTVRFVLDRANHKIRHMDLQRANGTWYPALKDEVADLQDSLLQGNDEAFNDPSAYGLMLTTALPEWAPQQ